MQLKTASDIFVDYRWHESGFPRVLIAPLTSKGQSLGCRPELTFEGKPARILLDQLRCVEKSRLGAKMGEIDTELWLPVLLEMLA